MNERELSESEVERLLSEGDAGRRSASPIEAAIEEIRASYRSDAPQVGTALAEFVDVGLVPGAIGGVAATQITEVPLQPLMADANNPSRRSSMRAALVTFAGSMTGKIVLGGTLTFAAAGGAQAAGIVDLPGIQQEAPSSVVTVEVDDEQPADELSGIEVLDDDATDEAADVADDAEYEATGIEEHRATVVDLEITAPAADEGVATDDDEADDQSDDEADHDSDDTASHDDDSDHDSDDNATYDSDDTADHDSDDKADHDSDDEADHDSDDEANYDSDDEADHDSDDKANYDSDDEADHDSDDEADHDSDDTADHDSDDTASHDDDSDHDSDDD